MQTKFALGPWEYINRMGAGHEILALTQNMRNLSVELPNGLPEKLSFYNLTDPRMVCIGCERWVQFEPNGWNEMQAANGKLIAAAPELFNALREMVHHAKCFHLIESLSITKAEEALRKAIEG